MNHVQGRKPTRSLATFVAMTIVTGLVLTPAPARAESGGILELFTDGLSKAWSFITGAAETAGDVVTPPTPAETLRRIKGEDKGEFWSMLEDAGYDLKEIDTEIGLIPGIVATYVLKRDLTEADREALELRLEKYARDKSGLIARLERAIIYGLLDASELGDYQIEEVKVQFLPLPSASFTLVPNDGPLSGEHDKIYRAVKEQTRMMRHVDREAHSAREGKRPPTAAPAARPASVSPAR